MALLYIDGKSYTLNQLRRYIKFYESHQIEIGQEQCPLCGSYYGDNHLFVCEECGELLSTEEQSSSYDEEERNVCKECCTISRLDKNYEDAVNSTLDSMRGK